MSKQPDKAKPENNEERPSWDQYFLDLVKEIGKRATCNRGKSGAIIVRDKRILCTGYVGSPPGLPHCDEAGHLMKKVVDEDGTIRQHCMRTIHAEQNAIIQAAKYGININDSTMYCNMEPCRICAMLMISVGIKRVVCRKRYHAAQETREMFEKAGVELEVAENTTEQYDNQ
ncbi:MAG: deoxycytidylate deaminase [Candidatus Woesearchaeota archaeon]